MSLGWREVAHFSLAPLLRGEGWGEGLDPRSRCRLKDLYPLTRIERGASTLRHHALADRQPAAWPP